MGEVLKVPGGSYRDYWFAESEVFSVRLVPESVLLVALLIMLTLTFFFGLVGALAGAALVVIVYSRLGAVARRKRRELEGKTVEELVAEGRVGMRVPYAEVEKAELLQGRLVLLWKKGRLRAKVPGGSSNQLTAFLKEKLGEKLSLPPG